MNSFDVDEASFSETEPQGYIEVYDSRAYEDLLKDVKFQKSLKRSTGGTRSILSGETKTLNSTKDFATFDRSELNGDDYRFQKSSSVTPRGFHTSMRSTKNKMTGTVSEETIKKRMIKIHNLQNQWNSIRKKDKERIKDKCTLKSEREEEDCENSIKKLNSNKTDFENGRRLVEHEEDYNRRRQERICSKWHEYVYFPIQNKVQESLTSERLDDIRRKRLDLTNNHTKGGAFDEERLQTINQIFEQQKLKINVNDPLKRDLMKIDDEKRLLHGDDHHSILIPKTKITIPSSEYASMAHLPTGRDQAILEKLRNQPVPSYVSGGKVMTNHFSIDRTQTTVKQQYFSGGRKVFDEIPGGKSSFSFDKL